MAEKEYIERGAALKKIDNAISEYARHGEIIRFISDCRASIIYATAADVVEVVRCKDCKHHVAGYCTREINGRTNMFRMGNDDFCSYGAKMDGKDGKI